MRRLALNLAVAIAFFSPGVNALGLGEIRVNSSLNEPLEAEIELLQLRGLKATQIRPSLADIDDFNLAGLSKSRVLDGVDFDVNVTSTGEGSVVITSNSPIREPFLSFLMEVNWPNGRLVREYTLLLDPPLFDQSPSSNQVVKPLSTVEEVAKPLNGRSSEVLEVNASLRSDLKSGKEVFVDVNDTLYSIALSHRPSAEVSVNQMMLAILRNNPQSFPTNNMNQMRAGTVMTMPSLEDARVLTRQEATEETQRQYSLWKAGQTPVVKDLEVSEVDEEPAMASPEPLTSPKQPAGVDKRLPVSDVQLKLVSVDENPLTEENQATADLTVKENTEKTDVSLLESDVTGTESQASARIIELEEINQDLEDRLSMTQENVAKVERDNADLSAKLDAIAKQLDTMQRLIELKDQQTAQLQAALELQMKDAQARGQDPMAAAIAFVRQNLEIVGAAAVLFLLLMLLLMRKTRSKPEGQDEEKTDDELPLVGMPESIASPVVSASAVDDRSTLSPGSDSGQQPISETESIAKAEAEIQSMIDEVLRSRASAIEQESAQDSTVAQSEPSPEEGNSEEALTEVHVQAGSVKEGNAQAEDIDNPFNEALLEERDTQEDLTDDSLERIDHQVSDHSSLNESRGISDNLEDRANAMLDQLPSESDVMDVDFIDEELESALSASGGSVESIDNTASDIPLDNVELDFVIEPFDDKEPDLPNESQIPAVEMTSLVNDFSEAREIDASVDSDQTATSDEHWAFDDSPINHHATDDLVHDLSKDLASNPPKDEEWDLIVEESGGDQLAHELDDILKAMESDVEVVEEVNDVDDLSEFDSARFSGVDENETRLDLARAYIEMDDDKAARDILEMIVKAGTVEQQAEAQSLLNTLDNT